VASVFNVPAELDNQFDMASVLFNLFLIASLAPKLYLLLDSIELDIDTVDLLAPVLRVNAAL
jgi:hypothetical protein